MRAGARAVGGHRCAGSFIASQLKGIVGIEIADRTDRGQVQGEPEPRRSPIGPVSSPASRPKATRFRLPCASWSRNAAASDAQHSSRRSGRHPAEVRQRPRRPCAVRVGLADAESRPSSAACRRRRTSRPVSLPHDDRGSGPRRHFVVHGRCSGRASAPTAEEVRRTVDRAPSTRPRHQATMPSCRIAPSAMVVSVMSTPSPRRSSHRTTSATLAQRPDDECASLRCVPESVS